LEETHSTVEWTILQSVRHFESIQFGTEIFAFGIAMSFKAKQNIALGTQGRILLLYLMKLLYNHESRAFVLLQQEQSGLQQ
jgi:hypothetical protein